MYNITLNDNRILKIYDSIENVAEKTLTLYFDPEIYSFETMEEFFENNISDSLKRIIKTSSDSTFIATFENYTNVVSIAIEKVTSIVNQSEDIPTLNEADDTIITNVTIPEYQTLKLIVVRLMYENPIDNLVKKLDEQINPSIDVEKCTLDELKNWQKNELNKCCFDEIQKGVDIELSDKKMYHFSYKLEDQINYTEICQAINEGCTSIPYHPDGGDCTMYSVEDMKIIITAQRKNKFLLTTKCNSYYHMVDEATTKDEVLKITWGSELSPESQNIYIELISSVKSR